MRASWASGYACALVLLGAGAGKGRAAWDNVFQVCCNPCNRPAVSAYVPVQTTYYEQRCYYEPEPCCRCGPIRRFLAHCFHPCRSRSSVVVVPVPPPAVVPFPSPPPSYLPAPAPITAPFPAPLPVPGQGLDTRPPTTPPVSINPSGNVRPLAPVYPRPLTPPQTPSPIRLDRFVSDTNPRAGVPATLASEQRQAP